MKVYVFGNSDVPSDNQAILAAKELENKIPGVSFVFVKPNEDVPFIDEKRVVILDTVQGIQQVELIEGEDIDRLILPARGSVHDFDLGFQLKYLKKLGKLGEIFIIGLPQSLKAHESCNWMQCKEGSRSGVRRTTDVRRRASQILTQQCAKCETRKIDYFRIQSILRKLVAQDIQGS
jgi:hypothetical protein